jgi:hypothetical protein
VFAFSLLSIVYDYSVSILAQVDDLLVGYHLLRCLLAGVTMSPNVAAANLFGLLGGEKRKGDGEADGGPMEKRSSLRKYEQVAAQVLACEGVSPIHECSNAQLWKFAQTGNKGVLFFSEFCSDDPYRRGIGGSRHAETMQNFGQVLEDPMMEKLLNTDILKKVKDEYAAIKPMLATLNGGKTSGGTSKSFLTMCKQDVKKEQAPVEEAAAAVYEWLSNENSAIHGFLQVMSWGGVFYAAMCSDKVARCAMDPSCGKISKVQYQELMVARLCGKEGALQNDDRNAMKTRSARLFGS